MTFKDIIYPCGCKIVVEIHSWGWQIARFKSALCITHENECIDEAEKQRQQFGRAIATPKEKQDA